MWFIYFLTSAQAIFACIIWLKNLVDYLDEKDEDSATASPACNEGLLSKI